MPVMRALNAIGRKLSVQLGGGRSGSVFGSGLESSLAVKRDRSDGNTI
jgi:hypothetical protein